MPEHPAMTSNGRSATAVAKGASADATCARAALSCLLRDFSDPSPNSPSGKNRRVVLMAPSLKLREAATSSPVP